MLTYIGKLDEAVEIDFTDANITNFKNFKNEELNVVKRNSFANTKNDFPKNPYGAEDIFK
jgi:hypothetical protein